VQGGKPVIPSVISSQVRQGIEDFLRTTFPIHTRHFDGVIERLLDARAQYVFKGPYVSVKLPYTPGTSGRDVFPAVRLDFPPYLHQEQAFQRLRDRAAQATLIATGTGSGKTECFLYPILGYCWQQHGEPGIKAIVVYPMNALATDQARRMARVIHTTPTCTVRCGSGCTSAIATGSAAAWR
jgi:DEAD/DEAH box helicase domain-containing protein